MSFLDKVWQDLAQKKKNQGPRKEIKFQQKYKGYRMIHIQDLERLQPNKAQKNADGKTLWKQKQHTQIYTYMQNERFTNEANNGFFTSFYKAYMEHGDIKIKPDQIWMMIMLWFSKYVDDNAEQLRKAFVTHEGKKELVVQTDRNLKDWVPFMNGIIVQIKKNTVQNVVKQLECNFTSTGLFQRVFSTALIMNTCKKYFDYTREGGGCGIVNAHMAGTLQDWESLQKKLDNLLQFDVDGRLKRYVRGLKPVLQQFTETFKGNVHLEFWNNLYFQRKIPENRQYMPSKFINGWLIKFFTQRNQISQIQQLQNFSVDIKYVDLLTGKITHFNLNGGCKGYSCNDYYVYTPHYSFAIVIDEKKMKLMKKDTKSIDQINKHKERIGKKNLEGTPIFNKKFVNIQFKNIKPNVPEVLYSFSVVKNQDNIKNSRIITKDTIKKLIPNRLTAKSSVKKPVEINHQNLQINFLK